MSSEEDIKDEESSAELELDADGEYFDEPEVAVPVNDDTDDAQCAINSSDGSAPIVNNTYYIIVPSEERQTSQKMSIFETAQIVETRADQIARSGHCMVDIKGEAIDQARAELTRRVCPLIIERIVGSKVIDGQEYAMVEHWTPNEMDH